MCSHVMDLMCRIGANRKKTKVRPFKVQLTWWKRWALYVTVWDVFAQNRPGLHVYMDITEEQWPEDVWVHLLHRKWVFFWINRCVNSPYTTMVIEHAHWAKWGYCFFSLWSLFAKINPRERVLWGTKREILCRESFCVYGSFISFSQVALVSWRIYSGSIQNNMLYETNKYSPGHQSHLGEGNKTNI